MNGISEAHTGHALPTRLGYKWDSEMAPALSGDIPCHLAREKGKEFRVAVTSMIRVLNLFPLFFF